MDIKVNTAQSNMFCCKIETLFDDLRRSRQVLNYKIQYFSQHWLDNWGMFVGAWGSHSVVDTGPQEGGSWGLLKCQQQQNINTRKPTNSCHVQRRTRIVLWKFLIPLKCYWRYTRASHLLPAKFNSTGLPFRSPSGFSTSISFGLGRLNLNFLTWSAKKNCEI